MMMVVMMMMVSMLRACYGYGIVNRFVQRGI